MPFPATATSGQQHTEGALTYTFFDVENTWVLNSSVLNKHTSSIGDGTLKTLPIVHNLGTTDVVITLFDNTTNEVVTADPVVVDANTITVSFNQPPAVNEIRAVIIG